MGKLPFEDQKFCQVRTLCQRWECSYDYVMELVSKGLLKLWHPEGKDGRGKRLDVESILAVEKSGYL